MNTIRFLPLSLLLACCGALAAPGPCDTPALAAATAQSNEDRIGQIRTQQKAREKQITDEITAIKKNMVASKRWTQQQSDRLPMPKLNSPAQLALEKRQMSMLMAGMDANMQYAKHMERKDYVKACPHAVVMQEALALTGQVNENLFLHMLDSTKKAAAGKP
jgi:hypothetical protein